MQRLYNEGVEQSSEGRILSEVIGERSVIRLEQALELRKWLIENDVMAMWPNLSFVYAVTDDEGLFKIGRSRNPQKRLEQLNTASFRPLRLHCIFPSMNAAKFEAAIHRALDDYHVSGEWFALPPEYERAMFLVAAAQWEEIAMTRDELVGRGSE